MTGAIPAYLVAHFAKSQLWHASTLLFGFFLTEACMIDTRLMGWIMAASLLLNALIDLGLGARWRDRVTRAATAQRLQARGAPLTCGFFMLFCVTPLMWIDVQPVWALATLIGFRASYPLLDVPQNALVALLPVSGDARCALLARRNVASGIAGIMVSALAAPLLIHRDDDPTGWFIWAGCVALFACITAWRLGRVQLPPERRHAVATGETGPVLPFTTLLGSLAVMIFACALVRTIEPYHAAFVGRDAGLLFWTAIGGTVSQPIWLWCWRRWSCAGVLLAAATLLLASAITLLAAAGASPVGAIAIGFGFGMGSGGLWLVLWTEMMTRAANGQAIRHVGVFTCVSKLAQSAAMLLTGYVLAASPYRATMRDPSSPPTLLMAAALAVVAIVCLVLAFGTSVNQTSSGGISARQRRAAPTSPAPGRQPA